LTDYEQKTKGGIAMVVIKTNEDGVIKLTLDGKLGATTSSQLQEVIEESFGDAKEVLLDFTRVTYVSTAGLWVIFIADKTAKINNGILKLTNVSSELMKVFYISGFQDSLTFV